MSIQQLRQKFSSLQVTPVEYEQWQQGCFAAQTGQTPQPHWTRWQRVSYSTWKTIQDAQRREGLQS